MSKNNFISKVFGKEKIALSFMLFLSWLLPALALAQSSPYASRIYPVAALPARCDFRNGDVVFLTSGNKGIYQCDSTGLTAVWTKVQSGGLPGSLCNVFDFGATGNGITNDSVAINAAIAACDAQCGTVYFPATAGGYLTAGALVGPAVCGISFYFDGQAFMTNPVDLPAPGASIRYFYGQDFMESADKTSVAVGTFTLSGLTTGTNITAMGRSAAERVTTATDNSLFGYQSGFRLTTGSGNTGVGSGTFGVNTTSSNSIAIGLNATVANAAANQIAIGANAAATAANQMVMGNTANTILVLGGVAVTQPAIGISPAVGGQTQGIIILKGTGAAAAFGDLGAATNGSMIYCSDCTIASPCAGGGNGAIAKRLNGVWVCN